MTRLGLIIRDIITAKTDIFLSKNQLQAQISNKTAHAITSNRIASSIKIQLFCLIIINE
jgi:hypothetical protein